MASSPNKLEILVMLKQWARFKLFPELAMNDSIKNSIHRTGKRIAKLININNPPKSADDGKPYKF